MLSLQSPPARFLVLLAVLLSPAAPGAAQAVQRVEREVILSVPRAADRRGVENRLALEGCAVVDELPALGLWLVALPDDSSVPAAVKQLAATRGVAFAEPNGWGEAGGVVPDDTYFGEQWPLQNTGQAGGRPGADIEAVPGWELTRGSPGVIVAVLDSGLVVDHPEFAGRTLPGVSFVTGNPNPTDDNGHGTGVASLLAANADNGFAIAGVDHRCTLLPLKVLDRRGRGSIFWLAQALAYAADAGADVISMSLVHYGDSQTLRSALQYARDAGCVLVACAGNGGIGDADRSFPGASPLTISVGATTNLDRRASFSGTGARLDLVAPGESVPVALRSGNSFTFFSGCSAATPIVGGIVALALSLDPTLTHDEIRALLVAGAEDQVGPPSGDRPGRDDQFGNGRVNLFRTLCALDTGGPSILGPEELHIEATAPGDLPGDSPAVTGALATIGVADDLDPAPMLRFEPPASLTLGNTAPVVFSADDACGNETRRTIGITLADARAPLLRLSSARDQLAPPNHGLVSIGLRAEATDAVDLAPAIEVFVYSDEPGGEESDRAGPDARIDPAGDVFLRAERDGKGDGRVYLCLVRATDDSGNAATSCTTVVVPHDASRAALADVRLQAEEALRTCQVVGAPPAGFSLLASGPAGTRARSR